MNSPENDPDQGSMTQLWQQMNHGSAKASNDLYARLIPRMYAIARKSIGPIQKRGIEADDVVQSAMISFWKYSETGKLADNLNRDDLWALVTVFTKRKMKKHFRRENAQKRGGGKVIGEQALQGNDGDAINLDQYASQMPTHDFDESVEELLASLDEELTRVALFKLSGYTHEEISQMLDCAVKTVERKVKLIKEIWSQID